MLTTDGLSLRSVRGRALLNYRVQLGYDALVYSQPRGVVAPVFVREPAIRAEHDALRLLLN